MIRARWNGLLDALRLPTPAEPTVEPEMTERERLILETCFEIMSRRQVKLFLAACDRVIAQKEAAELRTKSAKGRKGGAA